MAAAVNAGSKVFYVVAASVLGAFSATLLAIAAYQLLASLVRAEGILSQTLQSIGLVTIAMAVFEVAKFLVEEELIRERQLRSILEARRSLTKFFTIIVIVLSLEAIVLVFETKLEAISNLIYPTALMAVAVAAVVGLGLFQRLSAEGGSNRIGEDPGARGEPFRASPRETSAAPARFLAATDRRGAPGQDRTWRRRLPSARRSPPPLRRSRAAMSLMPPLLLPGRRGGSESR
jgi:hypothetical protein